MAGFGRHSQCARWAVLLGALIGTACGSKHKCEETLTCPGQSGGKGGSGTGGSGGGARGGSGGASGNGAEGGSSGEGALGGGAGQAGEGGTPGEGGEAGGGMTPICSEGTHRCEGRTPLVCAQGDWMPLTACTDPTPICVPTSGECAAAPSSGFELPAGAATLTGGNYRMEALVGSTPTPTLVTGGRYKLAGNAVLFSDAP